MSRCLYVLAALVIQCSVLSAMPVSTKDDESTNICGLEWSYCPRDPGCATYTMSVHDVKVHDSNSTKPIKVSDVVIGSELHVTITGKTTLTTIPTSGSYRVYSLQGPNAGSGTLTDALTLSSGDFTLEFSFIATAAVFSATDKTRFEFGVDVFQQASGSDEGQCIQVASKPYNDDQAAKISPPFNFYCKDGGDGHFTSLPRPGVPMTRHTVDAPACNPPPPPPGCDLKWYYCPRDPGCPTYTMSVDKVEVHTGDAKGYKVGDHVMLHINGTTTLKTIPVSGSYRIYTLAGHNGATGTLSSAFKLESPGHFEATIPFTIPADMFSGDGKWFEFGLDVFQAKSGSDEGMCIEVANPTYVDYQEHNPNKNFVTLCTDMGGGHFRPEGTAGVPEKVQDVMCYTP